MKIFLILIFLISCSEKAKKSTVMNTVDLIQMIEINHNTIGSKSGYKIEIEDNKVNIESFQDSKHFVVDLEKINDSLINLSKLCNDWPEYTPQKMMTMSQTTVVLTYSSGSKKYIRYSPESKGFPENYNEFQKTLNTIVVSLGVSL